jgi:glycosyltransferase involved in cell wall biosynthesis
MNLIFLCGLFPNDREKEITSNSKSIIHLGPNKLQWGFVSGLKEHFNTFTVITTPLLTNYPKKYRKLFFFGSLFQVDKNISGVCLGSIRLPLIGLISKFFNLFFYLIKKYIFSKDIHILVYSGHLPYLLSAVLFKIINRNTKICLFVNDLPQFMSNNQNFFYLLLKRIELSVFNVLQHNIDSYIFVTYQTNDLINKRGKPWVLIEGVYDIEESIECNITNKKKIIFYSGTLDSRYGLNYLLEAFCQIESSNYELWICGDGDLKSKILELSSKNCKIKYLGLVNHSEVIELQKRATVLVNPRQPTGEYTKYSFPIKTLEYLASGKPCIMYNLAGLPQDYLDFLIVPKDNTVNALKETILEVCGWDLDKRNQFCELALDFVKQSKSSKTQFNKLYHLLMNYDK